MNCRTLIPALAFFAFIGATSSNATELKPFVEGSWSALIAEASGRPTIIQMWGVTCGPCRVEMPFWGKLAREHPEVRLVTIHAERQPPKLAMVGEHLEKAALASAENWYFAERFLDKLRFEIDPGWHGETPMTVLINRDGTREVRVGAADFVEIERWIASELKGAQR